MRARFTSAHYHGTVVWSWQQALFAIGLDRQRVEAPELRAARATIAATMEATRDYRTSELWSFKVERGRIELVPFGQGQSHADESNALQLWSAVQLAIR